MLGEPKDYSHEIIQAVKEYMKKYLTAFPSQWDHISMYLEIM